MLTSRPIIEVHRPDRPERSPQATARPGSIAVASAGNAFSEGVKGLVPAAASIAAAAASKEPTPRGTNVTTAAANVAGQPPVCSQAQDVRAAFMKWLQEQMPEAGGSGHATAAASPRPGTLAESAAAAAAAVQSGHGGLYALQEEVLQGLTSSECTSVSVLASQPSCSWQCRYLCRRQWIGC